MKKLFKCLLVALILCLFTGCATKKEPDLYLLKINDYLYATEYNDYSFKIVNSNETKITGGCSSVRNKNFFGRNLDLTYSQTPEFVVHIKANENRYESIGVCANPYITTNVEKMNKKELLSLPAITNDGINECGVFASVHVVNSKGVDDKKGTDSSKEKLDGRMVVRYILDNASSADEAITLLKDKNIVGGFEEYGLHWMIGDKDNNYVVEIMNNELIVNKNYNYFTNFYISYGEVKESQTIGDETFENIPLLNDYAVGVERYNYIKNNYESTDTKEGILQMMMDVKISEAYNQQWLSDFVNYDVSIHASKAELLNSYKKELVKYQNRDRENPQGDWNTWHTSVYDIEDRTLYLYSQEDYENEYIFDLYK